MSIGTDLDAAATYGLLRITGRTLVPPEFMLFFPGSVIQGGEAAFADTLTLLDVPADARLRATVTYVDAGPSGASQGVVEIGDEVRTFGRFNPFVPPFEITFDEGTPIALAGRLSGSIGHPINPALRPPLVLIDLYQDVVLDLLDADGQILSDFTFSTDSGERYGLQGTLVPEPSSIVLIALGMTVCSALRRRHCRAAKGKTR